MQTPFVRKSKMENVDEMGKKCETKSLKFLKKIKNLKFLEKI